MKTYLLSDTQFCIMQSLIERASFQSITRPDEKYQGDYSIVDALTKHLKALQIKVGGLGIDTDKPITYSHYCWYWHVMWGTGPEIDRQRS